MGDRTFARLSVGGPVSGAWLAEWLLTHFGDRIAGDLPHPIPAPALKMSVTEVLAWLHQQTPNDDGLPFLADAPSQLIVSDADVNYGSWPEAEQDLVNAKIPFNRSNEAGGEYGAAWKAYRPEMTKPVEHDTIDGEWAISTETVRRFLKSAPSRLLAYLDKHYPKPSPLPPFAILDSAHERAKHLAKITSPTHGG